MTAANSNFAFKIAAKPLQIDTWLLLTAYKNSLLHYLTVPSLTPYDVQFSQNTCATKKRQKHIVLYIGSTKRSAKNVSFINARDRNRLLLTVKYWELIRPVVSYRAWHGRWPYPGSWFGRSLWRHQLLSERKASQSTAGHRAAPAETTSIQSQISYSHLPVHQCANNRSLSANNLNTL